MTRNLIVFISLLISYPPFLLASSRDEELLKESAKAGLEASAKYAVKGYLDRQATTAAENSAARSVGLGSSILFAFELGLSLDQFNQAKSDNGKAYATANAAVAAASMVNPAIGLIAGTAVLVVQIIDTHNIAQHSQDMMAIHTRIQENYKRALDLESRMTKAETARYLATIDQIEIAQKNIDRGLEFLKRQCQQPDHFDTMEKIDTCLKSTIQINSTYRRLSVLVDNLISTPSRTYPIEMLFKNSQVSLSDYEARLKIYREASEQMDQQVAKTLSRYSKMTAQILLNKESNDSQAQHKIAYKQKCLLASQRMTIDAISLVNPQITQESYLGQQHLDLNEMSQAMEEFKLNACPNISTEDRQLDRMYASQEKHFDLAYSLVTKALRQKP